MKIRFTRSGGLAGARLVVALDTEKLAADEADRLRRLVTAAVARPIVHKKIPGGADRFRYRIEVEEDDRKREIEIDESSVCDDWRPLLDYLTEAARAARKK